MCLSQIQLSYLLATASIWSLLKRRDCDWHGLGYILDLSLCLFPSPAALQQRLQPAGEYISNAFLKLYLNTRCKLGVFWLTKPNIGFRTLDKCI